MKIDYRHTLKGTVTISEAELIISDEALSHDELVWLQHQMWLLASTTINQRLADYASRMQSILAALESDTSAIILHREET